MLLLRPSDVWTIPEPYPIAGACRRSADAPYDTVSGGRGWPARM